MSEFYPDGKDITVAGVGFNIQPFVLKTRTKFLKILVDIISGVSKFQPNMKPDEIMANIPALIDIAGDKLIEVYKLVLEKDDEWLNNNVRLSDEVNIIEAIFEVNDIPFLVQKLKGLMKNKEITQTRQ